MSITDRLKWSQMCQAIASPSRSSSVASTTPFVAELIARLSWLMCFSFLLSSMSKRSSSVDWSFEKTMFLSEVRLRKCPYVAMTRKPSPKYFSIVEHLDGDSTSTRVYGADEVAGSVVEVAVAVAFAEDLGFRFIVI